MNRTTAPRLELRDVFVSFGAIEAVQNFSLTIRNHEFVALVGPSGCGKTTLLNLLAGFTRPSSGNLFRNGRSRMVHQQDGLFPWLTAAENIALGLSHVAGRASRDRQVADMLDLIGMRGFERHYPHQLSGGMRQRVELARALAGGSDILLLDEPFCSLDYLTRLRLRDELARLLECRQRTVVLVTHDIEEAAQLADRVVVLTPRPARIRSEFTIEAPRPRKVGDPDIVDAVVRILSALEPQNIESAPPAYTHRSETEFAR